jgi:hypothetical protein
MIAIEDTAERLDAIEQLFITQMPNRFIKRSLKDYREHDDNELSAGILTLLSSGEDNYKNQRGMVAVEGSTGILLIGHIKVDESSHSREVEDVELLFAKEIKAVINTGLPGLSFTLDRIEHSRQLEHPYGWLVGFLKAGPPRTSAY